MFRNILNTLNAIIYSLGSSSPLKSVFPLLAGECCSWNMVVQPVTTFASLPWARWAHMPTPSLMDPEQELTTLSWSCLFHALLPFPVGEVAADCYGLKIHQLLSDLVPKPPTNPSTCPWWSHSREINPLLLNRPHYKDPCCKTYIRKPSKLFNYSPKLFLLKSTPFYWW